MAEVFEPRYDHKAVERKIYKQWEESGYFAPEAHQPRADNPESKKSFCIIMPPPNANGSLHVGHALFVTLQDIMTRFRRMQGYKTLWLPGADHAGFETQIVYEKELEKQGRSRFNMRPENLYKEILQFTLENKKYMENQLRALGASCDWSREKFTLDPDVIQKTQATFKKMHDDGLLYRGKRIVNWCSKHQTSLSDVETEFKEKIDPFYYFQYGPFVIGTARPETKFGDKYVVMHPDDKRYQKYKDGEKIDLEWINGPITATVVKDKAIDMSFGTGVMTITPWHDAIDFDIAERHDLEKEQIIDMHGKLLPIAGEFAGMKIEEARQKIVEKLKAKNLLVKIDEKYIHAVRVCYKCERPIEPQIMDQWFVKMRPLADLALKAVADKKIRFIPERFEKIFTYWMENTLDWNISRQIVWGIPIPAWFHEPKCVPRQGHEGEILQCKEIVVSLAQPDCEFCDAKYVQDTDTFDTWFSSGQWPLITLGFPDSKDFKTFYPTDVMETAYDLIFRWVPRMVFFGLYLAGDVPFRTVYLHGLVNDAQGKKMSKSKGNVMNPLDMTEKYGTDALRIALIVGNPAGSEMALSEDKIRGYRNFSTKIWNAARFVLANKPESKIKNQESRVSGEDEKDLQELAAVKEEVTKHIEEFEFHLAAEKLYHYFWHTFADKIIEAAKPRLRGKTFVSGAALWPSGHGSPTAVGESEDEAPAKSLAGRLSGSQGQKFLQDQVAAYAKLETILLECLKMLHPFMPFVTEEIYQKFRPGKMLMVEKW